MGFGKSLSHGTASPPSRIHYKYLPVNHGSTHHRRFSIAFVYTSIFFVFLSITSNPKSEYEKPSLSARPSTVVPLGQTVTLQCHSGPPFAIFRLFKRVGTSLHKIQEQHFNTFTLGPVTTEHAGSYTCSGADWSRFVWSDVSDPLPIMVTDVSTKPSISAHPGPLVHAGENVTLRCHSSVLFETFILHKKSSTGHFQRRGETFTGGHARADFFIGPMTAGSAGTYRCYGSVRHSPYEWSAPSDPVDIIITGSTTSTCPSTMDPHTTEDVAIMNGEPMEDRTVNGEDSAAEDVIYAHLDLGTLSERQFTPAPLRPIHPSIQPIIYEEFNIN
ncbi:hypothetical protein MJG53_013159 [Ovis ammon polii x Ovis aries]|uniref:Uncharacterized protein n=1 Tax=Ovis ammon polii x Ovis aries TaxID=2918886 RepID=A0ACB9UHR9_9CETA|nr:hypothetical protein MJG53_013159 [Ovis ammon polii x Ovis aries]